MAGFLLIETMIAAAIDTIRISSAALALAFNDPSACRPTGPALWKQPAMVGQAGQAAWMSGHHVALVDLLAHRLRFYAADGAPAGVFGARGSGPGEFGVRPTLQRWPGDSVGLTDPTNSRVLVFGPVGYVRAISSANVSSRLRTPLSPAPGGDGLIFLHGTFIGQGKYPTFRPHYRIVKWKEGAPGDAITVLRDTVWSTELKMTIVPDFAPVYGATNLARTTGFGATATHLFTHDNAHPRLHIHDARGSLQRVVVFDVTDPPVTAADRDSVAERIALLPPPTATWAESARREIMEWRGRFPATRAALHWHGTDREGGAWLGAHPPTTRGAPVFIRVSAEGAIDRCWRGALGARPLALARDRVVVVEALDEGDRVWVEATAGFPSR